MKFLKYIFIFVLVLLNSQAYALDDELDHNLIHVSGTGSSIVIPDTANVSLAINLRHKQANKAQNQATEIFNLFINKLKIAGLKSTEIQTSSIQLTPIRDYEQTHRPVIAYTAIQSINIKLIKEERMKLIPKVISLASDSGINKIEDLSFSLSTDAHRQARQEALLEATILAKTQAQDILGALDLNIKNIKSIKTNFSDYRPNTAHFTRKRKMSSNLTARDVTTPTPNIQAGHTEITAIVNMIIEFE